MFCYHDKITKKEVDKGIEFQYFGMGQNMNVFHWDMADGSIVDMHSHPEEKFGLVIKGELELFLDDKIYVLIAGDGYIIPANGKHSIVAIGQTEIIEVFSPIKKEIPGE
jgi:quercetin dioxygenase-like cupin family protein